MSNPFSKYKFDRSKQLKRNDSSSSNSRGIENGMTGSLTSNGSLEYTMEEPDSPNFLDTSIVNNKESNTTTTTTIIIIIIIIIIIMKCRMIHLGKNWKIFFQWTRIMRKMNSISVQKN